MSIKNIGMSLMVLLFSLTACKQSPPPELKIVEKTGAVYFSGYYWDYKDRPAPVGPGPNRFLGTKENAFVDSIGRLHLKITKRNGFWYCSEIISVKEFKYGTYIFTCETDIRNFDERVVFGFFTWDDYSFQTQGNSEIDVEFSKWNVAGDTSMVTFSAQPVWFSNPAPYPERTYKPKMARRYISKSMTYMMKWTPEAVFWESYEGEVYPGANKTASWKFDNTNITRTKIEGAQVSNPIIVPAPSDSTNVRFNFWLLNGAAPNNGLEHEIVVKNFSFIPL